MIKVLYSPRFQVQFSKFDAKYQIYVYKKVQLFIGNPKHASLRTHKLSGQLEGLYSFSVDYTMRIVFEYGSNNTVIFLKIGDHSVYR